MNEINNINSFYLGDLFDPTKKTKLKPFLFESKNFTTHAVCVGMTGSGKTGLGIDLLEEAGLKGIPALILDPKGDMTNLALTFKNLDPHQFASWIDKESAMKKGENIEDYSKKIANEWNQGLIKSGQSVDRIEKLHQQVETTIYTPASQSGIPLSILSSFAAPKEEDVDSETLRDRILSTTSSLLGLLEIEADPINSREYILLSKIIEIFWKEKKDLNLAELVQQIQKPPFDKIGVLDLETYYSTKERVAFSMKLNNLLASSGFQAWMIGEPLDVQKIFFTDEGKPRLAIIYIAHLSDSERMFFVTLLLNELLAWMRRLSGSSNLRFLFYMDEIYGYFPPIASPPSKKPMITLLKQSRAYGLGVILVTQNPVDLDYKGLANCGTWFIGKLQTERDKSRVLQGLNVASNGNLNSEEINRLMASCGNRVFIVRSIYLEEPILFQTRWSLSYLRGPLTLTQIQMLMKDRIKEVVLKKDIFQGKPVVPIGIPEYYVVSKDKLKPVLFEPKILGSGKLHFIDLKLKIDLWRQFAYIADPSTNDKSSIWEDAEDITTLMTLLDKKAPAEASYMELPSSLMQEKNYNKFSQELASFLYQTYDLNLIEAKSLKLISSPDETEEMFKKRIDFILKQKNAEEIKKIQEQYKIKINSIEEKIKKSELSVESRQAKTTQNILETIVSFGTTILGAIFGRKFTRKSVSDVGISVRKAGRWNKEHQETSRAEESLNDLKNQLGEMEREKEEKIKKVNENNINNIELENLIIKPKKSDISVETIALVWSPSKNTTTY